MAPRETNPNTGQGWMDANFDVQGYGLSKGAPGSEDRPSFPTALCLAIVVTGLVLQSAVLILALVPIGAVAGWTSRHPFDLLWNYGLRHLTGAPPLPPNPTPRRHAFKLVAVCGLVTTTNFCVPSTLLGVWWRRRGGAAATT